MKCPGQDTQYWKPGAIYEVRCPGCGREVEFFKDDTSRKCPGCGKRFVNPEMDFGCAAYCQFAEQCLGDLPPEVAAGREDLLKDRVAVEMKRYFGRDFKRIGHATRVARYAERIGKNEGGDLAVILAAAYLHDIGFPRAEAAYGSEAPSRHEEEGRETARGILSALGAPEKVIEEVGAIIAHHHHPGPDESRNYKAVYDADLIVNLEEDRKSGDGHPERLTRELETRFLTETGRQTARKVLAKDAR